MRSTLRDDLDRWVDAGLLSREQSAAIYEAEATRIPARAETGLPAFAEVLGYAGAALACAGIAIAIGQSWEDFGTAMRVASLAVPTVLVILAGLAVRKRPSPAFGRLASVLLGLGVGGVAGTAALVAVDVVEVGDELAVVLVGASMIPVAFALWRVHLHPLQQLALGASVVVFALGMLGWIGDEPPMWAFALTLWSIGVVWALGGLAHVLEPDRIALVAGAILAAFAGIIGPPDTWFLGVAIVTSLVLMGGSIPTGELALLGIGAVSLFFSVTSAVLDRFSDTLGVPVSLTLIGGLFIALAVGSTRIARLRRRV